MRRSLLLLALVPAVAAGQEGVARGRTVHAVTGGALPSVIIADASGGRPRTMSAPDGTFRVRAASGRLVFARLGFAPETVDVQATEQPLRVALRPVSVSLAPTLVRAEQPMAVASSSVIRSLDLQLRPRASSQELLRAVPGLVIAQHAGGGKAEQIFLRGFDVDHGTDVAISVDGIPVNLVSHGHGQGYADLHFLIPEIVERLDVRKGPYDVRDGDLATAGAVRFTTRDRLEGGSVQLRAGSFGAGGATALIPLGGDASRPGGYVAAQVAAADGPFDRAQDIHRTNLFARFSAPVRGAHLTASASTFESAWDASGQIPERAVRAGTIGRFGALDATEGGGTARSDVAVALSGATAGGTRWEARGFASRYRFRLFSNFTFFLDDSVNGDGIEQRDERVLLGGELSAERITPFLGGEGTWRMSAGVRHDDAEVGLHSARNRQRFATRRFDDVAVTNRYLTLDRSFALTSRVRASAGMRADGFAFDVVDRRGGAPLPRVTEAMLSPKLSIAAELSEAVTAFVQSGRGFHSNDARAVVAAGRNGRTLPAATGAELGVRGTWSRASVAASLWRLDLQSELVWSGDAGTTEASGRTRRTGIDFEGRAPILPWLWGDVDVTIARGRLRDDPAGADHIPLAPRVTSTGGLTVPAGKVWTGSLRYRHIGSRPANEDDSVRALGYTLLELSATRKVRAYTMRLAVDNLLDRVWNEAQFATTSRLRGEAVPVTELHFTPGAPRAFTITVERSF